MDQYEQELNDLIAKGKAQGYLTFDEVNAYLPDEDVSPEKIDNLLLALDELGIQLVDRPPVVFADAESMASAPSADDMQRITETEASLHVPSDDMPKAGDDPIRMYLSQMAEIPLLSRDEEISLAKKIEVTRKRFRRTLLSCDFALRATVDTLTKVFRGELPFDRTIKVSLTERLTKEQILARMPHNLRTLEHLIALNKCDFAKLIKK